RLDGAPNPASDEAAFPVDAHARVSLYRGEGGGQTWYFTDVFGAAHKVVLVASLAATGIRCATPRVRPDETSSGVDRALNLFAFQSEFWVNLHHRLYEEAGGPKPAGPSSAAAARPH